MLFPRAPTLLSLLAIVLSSTHTAHAKPFPRELEPEFTNKLEARQCANPCGWAGQLCCTPNQYCYTDASDQAQCGERTAAEGGSWQVYTTTYVETGVITVTTTYTVYNPAATTALASGGITCSSNLNETPCGSICCASGQFCQRLNQCAANEGGSSVNAQQPTPSPTGSPFIRPTSGTVITITQTGSATTTVAFQTAITTEGSAALGTAVTQTNNGLSPGAIAGIVLGVLAALFILLLILLCCCAKGILDGCLSLIGLGKRKTVVEETEVYSHHSHHSSRPPPAPRRWFGMGPPRPERPDKKSSGLGGLLGVAGFLGALAIILGLKRRKDRKDEKSDYDSRSSASYSYYTSESE
jgi:hypothetical protein